MPREQALVALVNDDLAFVQLLDSLLRNDQGIDTLLLHVGAVAQASIKQRQPDLVILDISIDQPTVSWRMIDLLLLDPATASIPVLICSVDDQLLRQRSEKLKTVGYHVIEKPYDLDELLNHVRPLLAERGSRAQPDGLTRNTNS